MDVSSRCGDSNRYGWAQSYVGVRYDHDGSDSSLLACDVELIVRDLFELREVFVEDVIMILLYWREHSRLGGAGVFKVGLLFSGLPCVGFLRQGDGWSPDVSSEVHERVYSESLGVENDLDLLQSIAAMKEVFHEDGKVVKVQQFYRSAHDGGLGVWVPLERGSPYICFQQSRLVAPVESQSVAGSESDTEVEDFHWSTE